MIDTIVILGGSVRSAAQSAVRGGLRALARDQFGDADLAASCDGAAAPPYPTGLVSAARAAPPGPWMYTGAFENHPRLIAEVSRRHRLLGNGPAVLRGARDPFAIERALRAAGLPALECRPWSSAAPADGTWFAKPWRSAGGQGAKLWTGGPAPVGKRGRIFLQRYVAGRSVGASFLASRDSVRLLGVCEQLQHASGAEADSCGYAGSLGPLPLDDGAIARFAKIGETLHGAFGLVGLFGVDAIIAGDDVWPIEINPRWTASMELLERAAEQSYVAAHVAACEANELLFDRAPAVAWQGKRILYAERRLDIDATATAALAAMNQGRAWPVVADIPHAGVVIHARRPILTVFASAPTRDALLAELDVRAKQVMARISDARNG